MRANSFDQAKEKIQDGLIENEEVIEKDISVDLKREIKICPEYEEPKDECYCKD
ncbi:hypothetical protein ER45_029210 (plasmid) [Bacillus mycoides]|nr:hypothetical protein ER45_029210 [Bacillus mycoides]